MKPIKTPHANGHPKDYDDLFFQFKDGGTIREFVNAIERLARVKVLDPDPEINKDKLNTFKGDILEVFAELFFDRFHSDVAYGLMEYQPVAIEDDYGVDAMGINPVGIKVAVQVKYRANVCDMIEYKELARTYVSAIEQLGLDLSQPNTIYLFTTGKGANYVAEKVMGKKLCIINREIIAHFVDNYVPFWQEAYQRIFATLDQ